jgi:hypothetical protein
MDAVFLGAIALFFFVMLAFIAGCAKLGGEK